MLRRLHPEQPESFAFTEANQAWAEAQLTKFPEGRQASAIIPLLWRAQEQEGWLTRPAIEHVADMLGMAHIRALEVATFYFMFQLQPVGSVAHVQVCGTTSCMICGAEDLIAVCQDKIARRPHQLSEDGKFSWEEVECLGACANAPMAQIGKDYYEDLTADSLGAILDRLAAGEVPQPGSQTGRFASEPAGELTALTGHKGTADEVNAAVRLARDLGDTVKRIDGTEALLRTPWQGVGPADPDPSAAARDDLLPPEGPDGPQGGRVEGDAPAPRDVGTASDGVAEAPGEAPEVERKGRPDEGSVAEDLSTDDARVPEGPAGETDTSVPGTPRGELESPDAPGTEQPSGRDQPAGGGSSAASADTAPGATAGGAEPDTPSSSDGPQPVQPPGLDAPRGEPDRLTRMKGIGPKVEERLHALGIYHFDQIAAWTPAEFAWIDENLEGFRGRASQHDWIAQAREIGRGGS